MRLTVPSRAEGRVGWTCSSTVLPHGQRPCLSRRAGDLRYSLRPTHPGDALLRVRPPPPRPAPDAPAWRELLGPRVRTGEPRGRSGSWRRLRRGAELGRRPPSLSGAAPPYSGRGRGRWLSPPPRGPSPAQAPAWRRAPCRSTGRPPPSPPPAQLLAHPQRPPPRIPEPRSPPAPDGFGSPSEKRQERQHLSRRPEALPRQPRGFRVWTRKRFPRPGVLRDELRPLKTWVP